MKSRPGQALRIFIGEREQWDGVPLYEALVSRAKEAGLAGATVFRGLRGFGRHAEVHRAKLLRSHEHLPVVVEIVDVEERIAAFLPIVHELVHNGTVVIETVTMLLSEDADV